MTKLLNAVKGFFLGKGRVALQEKEANGDVVYTLEKGADGRVPFEAVRTLLGVESQTELVSFWEEDLLRVGACADAQEIILNAPVLVRVRCGSLTRVFAKRP